MPFFKCRAEDRILVVDYIDRTLRTASTGALVFGILGALWLGQAASITITKAANLSYRPEEGRTFWRLRSACLIVTLGFTLFITALTLAVFNVGVYASRIVGLPFKWITPGGFIATVLLFVSSVAFSYYVANLGSYGLVYGQLGTVIIFMIWLYVTGLMVLLGLEIDAILARAAEEQKDIKLVQ